MGICATEINEIILWPLALSVLVNAVFFVVSEVLRMPFAYNNITKVHQEHTD